MTGRSDGDGWGGGMAAGGDAGVRRTTGTLGHRRGKARATADGRNDLLVRLLVNVQPNGCSRPAERLGRDTAQQQLGAAENVPAEHRENFRVREYQRLG